MDSKPINFRATPREKANQHGSVFIGKTSIQQSCHLPRLASPVGIPPSSLGMYAYPPRLGIGGIRAHHACEILLPRKSPARAADSSRSHPISMSSSCTKSSRHPALTPCLSQNMPLPAPAPSRWRHPSCSLDPRTGAAMYRPLRQSRTVAPTPASRPASLAAAVLPRPSPLAQAGLPRPGSFTPPGLRALPSLNRDGAHLYGW